ncbi:MAG: baseplate J/gp47 family protein [Dysosmobacter sp.]|uniref:baseplate J/gp47 family protein n=1 Tax=Dysosmobacter sp. TaxID=2591382 RepID=UPI00283C7C05|nr:baseplate J/gp47 family protein [Dysosmobacter sp.]MDR3983750.1 baseplate J/gp47 family protein [Dysosmobacter sp.]
MSETLDAMLSAMPESYQKTVGFPTYDLLAAASIPMEELAAQLQETAAKLNPANLTGEELESYIKSRSGLVRNPPTYASGILQVTGNGTVNEGDLFESAGGIQFAATATVEISGSGEVPIRCTTPGAAGNLPAGSVTMMPVQIAGIVSVSNSDTLTGGYDAESDAAYYDRYILRLQTPPTSGNQYHYRIWALEVTGVGGVQIYPLGHGDNTVDVVIIDVDGQPADEELIGRVQTYIDPGSKGLGEGEAPIGAYCYVSGAEPKELDISMTVQTLPGAEQEAVTAAVKAAVAAYLKGIAFAQDYVSYARINAAVLEADGVQDVSGLTVNGATANVAIGERQVAVLGEVSIQYGAGA